MSDGKIDTQQSEEQRKHLPVDEQIRIARDKAEAQPKHLPRVVDDYEHGDDHEIKH